MGLLSVGEPLTWSETKALADHVRQHGVQQFINLYRLRQSRTDDVLKWGDEIEYMVVKFDHANRKVRVSNRAIELLQKLQEPETNGLECPCLWRPEFGAYMVEGTPGHPYSMDRTPIERYLMTANSESNDLSTSAKQPTSTIENSSNFNSSSVQFSFLNVVEANMRLRRQQVRELLHDDEAVLTISSFPRLGTHDFCHPSCFVHPTHGFGKSLFFPDQAIYAGHPRFRTLVQNIRQRRGCNVEIFLPIYPDVNTSSPFQEDFVESMNVDPQQNVSKKEYDSFCAVARQRQQSVGRLDQVYMDAMGFGMGCCCLQVTFQASTIHEACHLYDQLTPLTPVMMALSAASPVFRGFLTNVDCRWSVIASSVDDRTKSELTGRDPLTGEPSRRIPKSRFDSVDLYISEENQHYNDIDVVYDKRSYNHLVQNEIPVSMAKHIAHLFIRDPLVLFKEKINIDDEKESDHFENIQSTNWQTMRFKPPPMDTPEIGWRVEFRPMEIQLTDADNAAFVIFIVLITRLVLSFNLNILIPLSKVEENMKEAQKRDAAQKSKFWFRRQIFLPQKVCDHFAKSKPQCLATKKLSQCLSPHNKLQTYNCGSIGSCCVQLSIDEIINGTKNQDDSSECDNNFPGLIPLLNFYLDSTEIDAQTRCILNNYLNIISMRARGEIPTPARLIRDFVTSHDEYRNDSLITEGIVYDLLRKLNDLQTDRISMTQLINSVAKQKQNHSPSTSMNE